MNTLNQPLSSLLACVMNYQGPNPIITGLCVDSRSAQPGDLFLANTGVQGDARLFIEQAIKQGVAAVVFEAENVSPEIQNVIAHYQTQLPLIPVAFLTEKIGIIAAEFYHQPAAFMHITGITGTNGKTSCASFLTQALDLLGKQAAMMGTIGNGRWNKLKETTHTTLCALPLQQSLYEFCQEKIDYVTMEVSSHALHQHRVAGVPFEVAVFTNLTLDHLDYHQTMQAYGEAKARLFQWSTLKTAVINLDDAFADTIVNTISDHVRIIGVSLKNKSHARCNLLIQAKDIFLSADGTSTQIFLTPSLRAQRGNPGLMSNDAPEPGLPRYARNDGSYPFKTHILGEFNLSNLLLILGALIALDIPFEKALEILAKLQEPPGRLTKISNHDIHVFIDYAHTPDALEKVLSVLKPLCQGQLWCVFGCGGDRDASKRPVMAEIAQRYANQIIVTDDNPRTEDPKQIVHDIMQGFEHSQHVIVEHDRSKAIEYAITHAKAHDFVLIAGKGHEDYQIIGTHKYALSDLKIAQNALQNLV